jgi:hypothetical protein
LRQEKDYYVIDESVDVGVRIGDHLLGHCELDAPPLNVLISSAGLGIAMVDVWPHNLPDFNGARKSALVIASLAGEVRFRKDMSDLFGTEKDRFPATGARVPWLSCAWIDENRQEVIIVTAKVERGDTSDGRLLRAVSFGSGEVRKGEVGDIVRAIPDAIRARNSYKLDRALDFVSDMKIIGAMPFLPAILEEAKLPLPTRLRAGRALNDPGDKRGINLLVSTALDRESEWSIYAIEQLPEVLREDALPVLQKVVQQEGNRINGTVGGAFRRLGRGAVLTLVRLVDDENNVGGQADAISILGMIGPEAQAAVPSLIRALGRKTQLSKGSITWRISRSAAWALGQIGPGARDAMPALVQLSNDDDEEVRRAADEALRLIQNPQGHGAVNHRRSSKLKRGRN